MTSKRPFFSVIIPVYERHSLLGRTLASIKAQSFEHAKFECIIVDDGSKSPFFFKSFFVDNDITFSYFHFPKNRGVSFARNYGIEKAKGEWIAFLDSDDEWLPDKLLESFNFIQNQDNMKIFQTNDIWVRNGKRVKLPLKHQKKGGDIFKESTQQCFVTPSSVVIHHSLFKQGYLFDIHLKACEDYELWLRLSHQFQIHLLPQALTIRHQGHSLEQPQLSFKYPQMDRFRVYALQKLLASGCVTEFKKTQLLKSTIKKKSIILYQGAFKRKRYGYALLIYFLFNMWKLTKKITFKIILV